MPEKEGAEEKSTKSVVNKKQKQMMGEEGYDHLRDQGRIRKNKKKKDATTLPVSDEVKKTQKVNKGPSALERVKADIEKRYGKDAIMKVKKESTELLEMGKKFGSGNPSGKIDKTTQLKALKKLGDNTPVKKIDTDIDVKTEEAKSLLSTPGLDKLKKLKDFKSNADRVFGRKSPDLTKVAESFGGYIVEMERIGPEYKERIANMKAGRGLESGTVKYSKNKSKVTKNLTGSSPKITGDTLKKSKRNLFPKAGSANTPAVKKVKSGITKRLATQTKTAQKKLIKTAAKKAATRGIGKTALKFGAKRVPGLGAIISGAEAVGKLATGDVVGAGLAAGEGILSSIPGVGTVASTALGGYSAVRDARRAAKATSTVRKVLKSTKGAKGAVAVKKAFKTSPRTITKKLSPTSKKSFKGFMGKVKDPKTTIGKAARIGGGIGLDVVTPGGITKKIFRGIVGGAKKAVDGSHVGRRTAG